MHTCLRFCFVTTCVTLACIAAPPSIGVATAVGTFQIDNAEVEGNANVFDGAEIRTGRNPSQVYLRTDGAAVTLGIDSAGLIYRDHLVLEQGATRVDNMLGYTIQVSGYRIQGDDPRSEAVVRLNGPEIQVAALTGSLRVLNQKGTLLSRVGAGTASAFGQQPSGAPPNTANRRKETALYAILLASLGGLGLAVDAILQPGTKSSVSP
ncbi:MAG: hypothetical protein JO061_11570 [Acidobacteriaceae bacterium]|nr:hypothetical protein [Acidobacteriaceae bacterium]